MTIYYVSPMGNDDFTSIQDAANIVNPGDTIIVRDGVYDTWGEQWSNGEKYGVFLRHGGTSENSRVTIKSEHKWGAIISLNAFSYGTLNAGFGHNTNVSYVTIEDFTISGSQYALHANNNNKNITFIGNHVYNMLEAVSIGNECDYINIDSNLIHDTGIADNQHHAVYIRGKDAIVQNNIIYNYKGAGWLVQTGSYSVPPTGIHKVINNTLIGHGTSNHGQICYYSTDIDNILIHNNILYNPGSYIIRLPEATDTKMEIQNNLISNNLTNYFSNSQYAPEVLIDKNNIINQDPKFVNVTNKDFYLQSTSPCIGKGLTTNAPLYDFDGNPRTGRNDIGAFQYTGSIIPELITNFKVEEL